MPRIKGIAHVELSVFDLDGSASWYTALLDATETFRAANDAYAARPDRRRIG
jgi:catechol 2,3-dioxygenase-like lactoylglutathione lyase family enzyme